MPKKLFTIFLFFALILNSRSNSYADFSCSASVSPSSATTSTYTEFSFQINNTGSTEINWVGIRPDENFSLVGYSSDWIGELDSGTFYFRGGTISSSDSKSFGVNATAGLNEVTASWTVQGSESQGGELSNCEGSLSVSLSNAPVQQPPVISNASVVVNSSTAVISWTTDVAATSTVNYGLTSAYGSTEAGASLTSHSFTISSLTASTAYHYKITSSNGGGTAESGDNTFTTAAAGVSVTTTTAITTSTSKSTTTSISASVPKPTDKTAPVVSLDFDFSKPFREAPKITGIASDTGVVNPGVSKVEYSTDDGKNWIPVDKLESRIRNQESSKKFDFTPVLFEDGDYKIKARATDLSGNKGLSKSYTLVIDRLPPGVGGTFISFGPQGLLPGTNGITYLLKGLDQKITLSAVGGPIEIQVSSNKYQVPLVKNPDNGLWSGELNFDTPGTYQLIANSKDGAKNITERTINTVEVLDTGRVVFGGKEVGDAQVSVYYLEPSEKQFVLWDAESYGQKNPQKTKGDGSYALFLPGGSYYVEVVAPGFRTFKSDIFTVSKSFPVNSDIVLEKEKPFKFLFFTIPIPDFTLSHGKISLGNFEATPVKNDLIGKEIPEVELFEDGKSAKTGDFRGKPFVLTFINTWHPASSEQIKILENLSSSDEFETAIIIPQESKSKVGIYKKRGGYTIPIYSDPDGTLVEPLNLQTLPTHVFLDRTGKITDIKTGILSEEELKNNVK